MCGRFFVVVNKSAQVFCVGAVLPFSLTSRLLLLARVRTLFSKRLCTSKFMFLAEHSSKSKRLCTSKTHKRELLPCHSHMKSSFHTTVKSARPRNGVCQSKAQVRSRIHVHLNLMLQCIGRGRNARNGTFSPPPPPPPFLFGFEHLESPSNVIHLSGLVLHIPAWRRS